METAVIDDILDMPGHLIRRVKQLSTALFIEECAEYDMTSVQFAALQSIAAHPGVDATRLSALIAFDRSTIGDVLDRMETKGWIVRKPAPGDRRIKLIELSADGASLLRCVGPAVHRVQERILAPLDPADRRHFIRILQQLADTKNERPNGPV